MRLSGGTRWLTLFDEQASIIDARTLLKWAARLET